MAKIRIGIVGAGSMGQMAHLKNYANIGDCEVAALAETRPELGRLVANRYGIPKVYQDHLRMIETEKPDGVVAIMNFSGHSPILPRIYPLVRYVLTEKPLAVSVEAGEKMAAAAAKAGCVHMVGYHKRSDPAVAAGKTLIEEWRSNGEMGRMKYVRITMPEGDWTAAGLTGWLQTDEKMPDLEKEPYPPAGMDKATASRYVSFVNYYIHQVNLMRHLLCEPYRVVWAEKSGVLLAVESRSGIPGIVEMTPYRTTIEWEESALVAFEKGYIRLRLPAPVAVNRAGVLEIYRDAKGTPERVFPTMPWTDAMHAQAINFVKVIKGEMGPPCDASEALEDLKVARDCINMQKEAGNAPG